MMPLRKTTSSDPGLHVSLDIADIIDDVLLGAVARLLGIGVDSRVVFAREHAGVAVRVPVRSHEHDRLVRLAQLVERYNHTFEDAAVLGGVVERAAVGDAEPHADPMQAIADDTAPAAHGLEARIGDVWAAGRQRFLSRRCTVIAYNLVSKTEQPRRSNLRLRSE